MIGEHRLKGIRDREGKASIHTERVYTSIHEDMYTPLGICQNNKECRKELNIHIVDNDQCSSLSVSTY